jgi:hypothetical protein
MTLLLSPQEWERRAELARGPFASLADNLAATVEALARGGVSIPREKALLSREGGRCAVDGTYLAYDPFEPHRHRCAACGATYEGPLHDRFRLYWHQLWLAERALHAAILWRLRGAPVHRDTAVAILEGYADAYLRYPNADNTLGPGRVFFSTYLESIWLLQLVLAVDVLGDDAPALGQRVRERVVEPSVALIASYDEGSSNRQVWNDVAMLAAGLLLGEAPLAERAVHGRSGIVAHLANGLLPDGTWYEGENYHLFAHRGLWYGVLLAERAGLELPADLRARFDAGFIAPFLTTFPDLTLPSRRDSPYAVSVRQPRFAELCELGLARGADARLGGLLARLYTADIPRGHTGQDRTSADVERNGPAVALTRADLGWRTLIFALPELSVSDTTRPLPSVLLRDQGIAVFRRDHGSAMAALDYGNSGGGHGHPDRLNLLLGAGTHRWLDDMGTGSYVERALHWYRSSLAHNAPVANGNEQPRRDGRLLAHDERGAAGWVMAEALLDTGVVARRTLVALDGYIVDELRWSAEDEAVVDLPWHFPPAVILSDPAVILSDQAVILSEAKDLAPARNGQILRSAQDDFNDAGWNLLRDVTTADLPAGTITHLAGTAPDGARLDAWLLAEGDAEWWRAIAPGPPATGDRPFHAIRTHGREGRVRAVIAWNAAVRGVRFDPATIELDAADGTHHVHGRTADGWHIELHAGTARSSIDLGGLTPATLTPGGAAAGRGSPPGTVSVDRSPESSPARPRRVPIAIPPEGLTIELGAAHYRRSEPTWEEAGRPTATLRLDRVPDGLHLAVTVNTDHRVVINERGTENPWDNEPADVNADGVQLYFATEAGSGGWRLPLRPGGSVEPGHVAGWGTLAPRDPQWREVPRGYELSVMLPLPPDGKRDVALDLLVNDIGAGRARRRGQLVLSGASGEWTYLRGDRHDPARLVPFVLPR